MLLDIQSLSCRYGRITAVHDVSLHVNAGEIVCLIGANGAGKTTLLRSISGLFPNVTGSIRFDGTSIDKLRPAGRVRLGLVQVPEGRQIFGPMRVHEHLELGAYLHNGGRPDDFSRVVGLFPVLGEKRDFEARSLSGGEQQMLAMGRALMTRPKLLLLDEPSLGLAPKLVSELFRIIVGLRTQGTSILMVEQNAFAALGIADRAYVLENGRLVLEGIGRALREDPRVKDAYLGIAEPSPNAEAETSKRRNAYQGY